MPSRNLDETVNVFLPGTSVDIIGGREKGHPGIIRKNKEGKAKINAKGEYRVKVSIGREVINKWIAPELLRQKNFIAKEKTITWDVSRPELIVFGLDGTTWVPNMFQLFGGFYKISNTGEVQDKKGATVHFLKDMKNILNMLATDQAWTNTKVAFTCRTHFPEYAHQCLKLMTVDKSREITLESISSYTEIIPSSKKRHFEKIHADSGIEYKHMLFYDNDLNMIKDVEALGVVSQICPGGVTKEKWNKGLNKYIAMVELDGERTPIPVKKEDIWVEKALVNHQRRMQKKLEKRERRFQEKMRNQNNTMLKERKEFKDDLERQRERLRIKRENEKKENTIKK